MTAAKLSDPEWKLLESISDAFALPSSPFYKSPVDFNRLVRSRIPPRGKRFANDHRDTCAYIERSKNLNVVAYTANFVVPAVNTTTKPSTDIDNAALEQERQVYERHYHSETPQKQHHLPEGMISVPSGRGVRCSLNPANPFHAYFVRLEPSYLEARRKKGIQNDCDELKMLERKFAYGYNSKTFVVDTHVRANERLRNAVCSPPASMPTDTSASASGDASEKQTPAEPLERSAQMLESLARWWEEVPAMVMSFAPLPSWPAFAITLQPLSADPSSATSPDSSTGRNGNDASSVAPAEGCTGQTHPLWLHDDDTALAFITVIDGELCVLEKIYVKSVEHWFGLPTVDYIEVFGSCLADGSERREKKLNNGKHKAPKGVTPEDIANS